MTVEHRLVTDRQTDRQTDRNTTTANIALAWRRAVKIVRLQRFSELRWIYQGAQIVSSAFSAACENARSLNVVLS